MSKTLHLMTQRGQPYGSVRKCCEICGLMMVTRPPEFWNKHAWVDNEDDYKRYSATENHESFVSCEDVPKDNS